MTSDGGCSSGASEKQTTREVQSSGRRSRAHGPPPPACPAPASPHTCACTWRGAGAALHLPRPPAGGGQPGMSRQQQAGGGAPLASWLASCTSCTASKHKWGSRLVSSRDLQLTRSGQASPWSCPHLCARPIRPIWQAHLAGPSGRWPQWPVWLAAQLHLDELHLGSGEPGIVVLVRSLVHTPAFVPELASDPIRFLASASLSPASSAADITSPHATEPCWLPI